MLGSAEILGQRILKLFKRAPHFSGPGVSPSNRGQGLRLFFEVLELQSGIIRCIRTGGAWHLQCHAVATQKVKFHQLRVLTVLVSFLCLESARRIAYNKMCKNVHLLMPLSLYVHFCGVLAFRSSTIHTNQRREGKLVTQPEPTHKQSQQTAV